MTDTLIPLQQQMDLLMKLDLAKSIVVAQFRSVYGLPSIPTSNATLEG